jgi:hypothetical protein
MRSRIKTEEKIGLNLGVVRVDLDKAVVEEDQADLEAAVKELVRAYLAEAIADQQEKTK